MSEGVSVVSSGTLADGKMISDRTLGVETACSSAGVDTFLV